MFNLEEFEKKIFEAYAESGASEGVFSLFRRMIYDYYSYNKRDFPWRLTCDPYAILVSEVMLQQTQTSRVIDKFIEFMELFPDFKTLARAPVPQLLKAWQGLGYNRRALNLQKAAKQVVEDFGGILPSGEKELLSLAGVGSYTSAAVQAFAFNQPSCVIDTNIRSIYIYFFFRDRENVTDNELRPLIEATVDRENPAAWYSALMDFGVFLKNNRTNPSRKSKHYTRQSRFEGSLRQIRGKIIAMLCKENALYLPDIYYSVENEEKERIKGVIDSLVKEKFIICEKNTISLYNKK